MHYLQGHFDYALGKIIAHIVPTHRYISVHDLFNPQLFHRCLLASINQIPQLSASCESLSLPTMMKEGDSAIQGGYIQQRMHNFTIICEVMAQAFDLLGLAVVKTGKETLFRMVKHCDLDELQLLLQQLFQLIIRNREILEFITTLGEEEQFIIKDFLQRARSKQEVQFQEEAQQGQHEDQRHRLEEENAELRNMLAGKEGELDQAHHHIHDLQDQIAELREMELVKEANIDGLKRRLIAYEETDALFQEKDEEIFKLQGQLGELQIANRLLSTQLKSQKDKLQGKVGQLQRTNAQLQTKCDRLVSNYELLSRQREDTQASNKRVITNLRDKVKALNERVSQLQGQLVQAKIGRELRQREFTQLMNSFQSLKSQSSDLSHRPRQQSLDRILINSSSGHGKQFLRLEEQLNQIDKLKQNAFEEEIMMFDSGEDNVKKVQEIIAENARLKERLSVQQSRGGKELLDENERLRKRCAILKRKADDVQTTHRQEMNVMLSAFDGLLHRQ